jgi:chromosome segregation ATPase
LLATHGQAALYKWVDEKGRVQYSDRPPTEKDKNAVQMTNRGIVVKKLDTAASEEQKKARDEELARKRQEEAKAAEQRRQDRALLLSFSSALEIDMKRDREVQGIETSIANLREQEHAARERASETRRRIDSYGQRGKPATDALKEDLRRQEAQVKLIDEEIARRGQEILATRSKYEELKKRYQELREEQSANAAPATAAIPAPPKK